MPLCGCSPLFSGQRLLRWGSLEEGCHPVASTGVWCGLTSGGVDSRPPRARQMSPIGKAEGGESPGASRAVVLGPHGFYLAPRSPGSALEM